VQPKAEVGPVVGRTLFYELAKCATLKNSGVVCKQAKQDADKKYLKFMSSIARCLHKIVQLPKPLSSFDVGRILCAERLHCVAR